MNVARPVFLWLLATAPAVAALLWVAGQRKLRGLSAFGGKGALFSAFPAEVAANTRRRAWAAALFLVPTVVALTGPGFRKMSAQREVRPAEVWIVLDLSRSMLAGDGAPTRLDQAKARMRAFLQRLRTERVGLVTFAGTAFIQCPLTTDYDAVAQLIEELRPDDLPSAGSRPGQAVKVAVEAFDPTYRATRALLLVTDGESTEGDSLPGSIAQARTAKVAVYGLGVGSPSGVPVPARGGGFTRDSTGGVVLSRLREETLRGLATSTAGRYARAAEDDTDLVQLYDRGIRSQPGPATALEPTVAFDDAYQWPLSVALLTLLWERRGTGRRPRGLALGATAALGLALLLRAAPGQATEDAQIARRAERAFAAGDYTAAARWLLGAQIRDPESPVVAYNLGNTRYRAGDFAAALASYRTALPDAPELLRAKIHHNMGNTAFRLARFGEAAGYYREALKAVPHDGDTRFNLTLAEARHVANKATKRTQPKDGSARRAPGSPLGAAKAASSTAPAQAGTSSGPGSGVKGSAPRPSPQRIPADPRARRQWAERALERVTDAPRPIYGRSLGAPPPKEDW